MAEQRSNSERKRPPKWTPPQIAGAFLILISSIVMFSLQALDRVFWGQDVDFGPLPWALLGVSVFVLFGLKLTDIGSKD